MTVNSHSGKRPVVVQVVGYKNTGKTTIVCRLTESLKQSGYTVATIKHDAHDFDIDHEGTDTWKHTLAGADMTIITSPHRTAMLQREPFSLEQLAERCSHVDWILAEGFKTADYPKLIIVRSIEDAGLAGSLSNPAAVIVWPDTPETVTASLHDRPDKLPVIGLNDTDQILRILQHIRDEASNQPSPL
ncbi:molybdopterin-guanine dinucleotide biosynthesis protein B [Paenibacillus kobensis]|uniref:molybdopterin-guanine dinucleotide biosynthesis protein B n=1 Tax=Paenibacillus kobensis TaxID=59841 RepID=UPI000FDB14BC|nr:molybdopterin-guanine dinucleotide biosynthesis protein B [Paenibacillus kobensis]